MAARLNLTEQAPITREQVDLKLGELDFSKRLYEVGIRHLFGHSDAKDRGEYSIALPTLQRMVIHDLQYQLVRITKELQRSRDTDGDIEEDRLMDRAKTILAEYTNANRDYDYMAEKLSEARRNNTRDPFMITTKDELGRCILRDFEMIPAREDGQRVQLHRSEDKHNFEQNKNILPRPSRTEQNHITYIRDSQQRFIIGILGGLALILPMLIMVLEKTLLVTLLTASVATVLFAGALAILTDMPGETVLGSVAAYAAVLVVFVGASS